MILNLIIASFLVLVLNIPFGYWRDNVKKFSLQWILAVHIPVPLVVIIRFAEHIGFVWYSYIFLIAAYFIGQFIGSVIHKKRKALCGSTRSCLVMDLLHPKC